MMMRWAIIVVSGFLSLTPVLTVDVRGLSPEVQKLYETRIRHDGPDGSFCCLDDSRCVPIKTINDDFCDCVDGSDEPGTSACAHQSGSGGVKFWCANVGYLSAEIPRSRVNDGICGMSQK